MRKAASRLQNARTKTFPDRLAGRQKHTKCNSFKKCRNNTLICSARLGHNGVKKENAGKLPNIKEQMRAFLRLPEKRRGRPQRNKARSKTKTAENTDLGGASGISQYKSNPVERSRRRKCTLAIVPPRNRAPYKHGAGHARLPKSPRVSKPLVLVEGFDAARLIAAGRPRKRRKAIPTSQELLRPANRPY